MECVEPLTEQGELIRVRRITPGEFRFDKEVARFTYEVSLAELTPSRMANVSWLTGEHGLLMLGDLLPLNFSSAVLRFNLPLGWTVGSDIKADRDQMYSVAEPAKTTFFVGRSIREKRWSLNSMNVVFLSSGEWAFTESQVRGITDKLFKRISETHWHDADEAGSNNAGATARKCRHSIVARGSQRKHRCCFAWSRLQSAGAIN